VALVSVDAVKDDVGKLKIGKEEVSVYMYVYKLFVMIVTDYVSLLPE